MTEKKSFDFAYFMILLVLIIIQAVSIAALTSYAVVGGYYTEKFYYEQDTSEDQIAAQAAGQWVYAVVKLAARLGGVTTAFLNMLLIWLFIKPSVDIEGIKTRWKQLEPKTRTMWCFVMGIALGITLAIWGVLLWL